MWVLGASPRGQGCGHQEHHPEGRDVGARSIALRAGMWVLRASPRGQGCGHREHHLNGRDAGAGWGPTALRAPTPPSLGAQTHRLQTVPSASPHTLRGRDAAAQLSGQAELAEGGRSSRQLPFCRRKVHTLTHYKK